MAKLVSTYKALLSGYRFNRMTTKGAPVFISYSFLTNGEIPGESLYAGYANNGYTAFTAAQKVSFRQATKVFEAVSGVRFIEVDKPGHASLKMLNTSGR